MNLLEHALVLVAEEATEIGHICAKSLRFGIGDFHPHSKVINIDKLNGEYNDLLAVIELLNEKLPDEYIILPDRDKIDAKKLKVERYIRYAIALGTLTPDPVTEWNPPPLEDPEQLLDEEEAILHERYGEDFPT